MTVRRRTRTAAHPVTNRPPYRQTSRRSPMTSIADEHALIPPQDHGGLDERQQQHAELMEAEQGVLGGMLLSKDAIADVVDSPLKGRDFYRPAHETVFLAILALYAKGEPADPITVAAELTKRGEIGKVGGASYLHTLVQATPTAANASYYAEIVHAKGTLRRLVQAGTRIAQLGQAGEGELDDIRNAAEHEMLEALKTDDRTTQWAPVGDDVQGFWDDIDAAMKGTGNATGILTGLSDFDSLTNGLQPGQLIVIGARPAMGKSTLALDMARAAAIQYGHTVAFFSLEMGRKEITCRLFSAEARVALHHIRSGTVTEEDQQRLARRTPAIQAAPLLVDDSPNLSFMEIRSKARRIAQQRGLDLLIVDYLQLMQTGSSRRAESRQQEVSDISRSMKLLAKELNIPVIALSQLNRGPEQRTEKKPVVSDLRESGSIEQDADMVILLHREDAYEKESARAGEADLIVGKHRNGPTATITVAFQGHYSRFVDMART
ncbi:replicative DNA helicase [Streptomyces sp. NPDC095613]|uniref:replicative DNA helicase n=1 Tax=Streptomyces sp. NPDC095613 TaxID=3155540 RepID=UPI003316D28D